MKFTNATPVFNKGSGNSKPKAKKIVVTNEEIASVIDQKRKDPLVISIVGKADTCKSGLLCDIVAKYLPEGKVAIILDFDHSIKPIMDEFFPEHIDKFFIINATAFGKDYKKGHVVALAALQQVIKDQRDNVGLLATEGMDRLLQRSFKMTLQARGYNMEDMSFFGKGGNTEFTPTDWMVRNDYNFDPFDMMFNYASELGVPFIMTTHTEDKINSRREIIKKDSPIWYKIMPDYEYYRFTTKKKIDGDKVTRYCVCDKARIKTDLFGDEHIVQEFNTKTKEKTWYGICDYLKENGLL